MTATGDDIVNEIHLLRLDVLELVGILRASAEANEPQLFCPPSEHCMGGFPLSKHAPKYWKNDGNDGDRLYHELPESAWYTYEGEGAFKGSTVRNHNVWRSDARRDGRAEQADDEFTPPWAQEDIPTRDVDPPPAATTFQNAGQLLTWALAEHRMNRTQVMALLQVGSIPALEALGLDRAAQVIAEHQPVEAH